MNRQRSSQPPTGHKMKRAPISRERVKIILDGIKQAGYVPTSVDISPEGGLSVSLSSDGVSDNDQDWPDRAA